MTKTQSVLSLATVATVCSLGTPQAHADPPPIPDLSSIFCLRITEINEDFGDPDRVTFTFEVLNWTDTPAAGLYIAQADPLSGSPGPQPGGPVIAGIGIDANGGNISGGIFPSSPPPEGDVDFGIGGFGQDGEHHSGRGTAVQPGFLNDWAAGSSTSTSASWEGAGGTPIPNRDLVAAYNSGGGNNLAAAQALVPGFGLDQLGDRAIDGGPGPYFAGVPGEAGEPVPFGSGNVLDGFTLTVDDLGPGEVIALNWFILDAAGNPLGTSAAGNDYGFGVLNLFSIFGFEESAFADGEAGGAPELPGPIFVGNTGPSQGDELFAASPFGNFGEFTGELGGGITAPFMNPADNIFGAPINAPVIGDTPPPSGLPAGGSSFVFMVMGLLGLTAARQIAGKPHRRAKNR